ncbi:MAG: UDP-glucose 4-epimerase GalE [Flavobacteriales bacterium]|nr:UDP-glucose 4-epimerase GalE [Flavobacteriales bacterium]
METKPKIIVTGGAGFIGSHTVVELLAAGYTPVIIDDFSNSKEWIIDRLCILTHSSIMYYNVDCKNYETMHEIFMGLGDISGIIHFAAYKSVSESVEFPIKYYDNNIGSLATMIRLAKDFNIPKFVFSSSCTVYGQAEQLPVTELTPMQKAESPYGYTKQVGEQLILDALQQGAVILRYFNPIGAHSSGLIGELPNGKPENLVPYITQTAIGKRAQLLVYGNDYNTPDGTCLRDYIHVVDLAKAHVKSLQYLDKNKDTNTFNVGTGRGNSVLEMVKTFEAISQLKLNYKIVNRRSGDIEQIYADTAKANIILNWKAEYGIKEALIDAWNWELNLQELKLSA